MCVCSSVARQPSLAPWSKGWQVAVTMALRVSERAWEGQGERACRGHESLEAFPETHFTLLFTFTAPFCLSICLSHSLTLPSNLSSSSFSPSVILLTFLSLSATSALNSLFSRFSLSPVILSALPPPPPPPCLLLHLHLYLPSCPSLSLSIAGC